MGQDKRWCNCFRQNVGLWIDFTCLFDELVAWCGEWQLTDATGETSENVPSPRSDVGNYDNYYGRRLRMRNEALEDNTRSSRSNYPEVVDNANLNNDYKETLESSKLEKIIYANECLGFQEHQDPNCSLWDGKDIGNPLEEFPSSLG
ncbi:unnamed protein product [Protopolystoma xenopodis]|uniref:Uncharacterized protein n=1 Tax=Protopolystoma xenopodis TaxID=117903 RepID=A0A448WEK0_9PLAT|nr:unnamed protein product [Protopolystoma xenopodis]